MSVFTNPAGGAVEQAAAYTRAVVGLVEGQDPMDVLRRTHGKLEAAVAGLSPAEMATPEKPGKWSIRQVLRHLADSEIVWAYRLRMVLAQERPVLTGYDQDAWAERLDYAGADAARSLADFAVLRQSNLGLLDHASPEDMKRAGVHAERGDESVEHMLKMYAGHDLLHIAQLERVRAAVTGR